MNKWITGIFLLITIGANAQIEKGSILIGGTGRFSADKSDQDEAFFKQNYKQTQYAVEPKSGIFVMDKLAVGLTVSLQHQKQDQYVYSINPLYETITNTENKISQFAVGPFLRYYLLPAKQKINLFSEIGWTYGKEKTRIESAQALSPAFGSGGMPSYSTSVAKSEYNVNTFSVLAGPVLFINPKVSFELSVGYSIAKVKTQERKSFSIGTGFLVYIK
ncbi:MAG: hypothetical protein JNN29_01760 [Chitinophagaceae bacterium]|nr:hypothetical protein [Chitinophagaceae bacterium]MBN8668005.1 hypothetical protein [Chitinophagales bacterium]